MKKLIKLFFLSILMINSSIGLISCTQSTNINESKDIDSIVEIALEDSEIKIYDYVDINYFTNLKEINSTSNDCMQLLSSIVENYEELDEDIDEIQYNSLTVAISNIFDDLSEEENNVFKTLADEDEDIAQMLELIESNFEISNTNSNVDLDTIKFSNIVKLATGVLEIGSILSLQQVPTIAIKVIKGAFNSMIAALKGFFIPNSLKVAIVTTAIVAITTVVVINWNKIQPVFYQIVDVFVGNAKKLGNTVSKVFDSIYQTASKSTSKDVQEKIDDILSDAEKGRDTKGESDQYIKKGGFDQANKDYDKLNPSDSKEINTSYGKGRTGKLKDGSKVNVRPGSSYGEPTLEIQLPNGRKIKIRYGN